MLNVAVVGAGYWGPNLIRNFRGLEDCAVKTVCDMNADRLMHLKRLYPEIGLTRDISEVLADTSIDAVAIATPIPVHYPFALASLRAGKHTFIEKPMASTSAQCQELVDEAARRSLTLMVGHTFIYTPTVRRIREIITSGELGEVMYISSRRLNLGLFQNHHNVVWDLAPHDLSIILYLLGEDPVSVNCQGMAHLKPGIEDVTSMSLLFPSGSFALVHNSWIDPKKIRETTIVGTRRMLVYDDIEQIEKIRIYDKCVERPTPSDTFAEWQFSYHYGGMQAPYIKQTEPLGVECQHFLDCIRSGTPPDTDGREGLRVVRILEAATQSLKSGGSIVSLGKQAQHLEEVSR